MLRYHAPFDGKRYVGDNRLKIFHDSIYETAPGGCRIDHIPAEEVRTFEPDTVGGAARRGFVPCPCCRRIDKDRSE
jgi:hypothetical protein